MKDFKIGLQIYGIRDLLEETPENFEKVMREVPGHALYGRGIPTRESGGL